MKMHYEFHITDRHGFLYHVTAIENKTRRGNTRMVFNLRPCRPLNAPPLMYVRYSKPKPATGAVYREYDFWTCKPIEPVSLRQFFPTWDMRKIRKEWCCLNG